jgi:hypothetical protein
MDWIRFYRHRQADEAFRRLEGRFGSPAGAVWASFPMDFPDFHMERGGRNRSKNPVPMKTKLAPMKREPAEASSAVPL